MIPYSRQSISKGDIAAVAKVLGGAFITRGPLIAEFEAAVAKKTGAKFAVAFSSGTGALQGAYFAAGIGKGDEVITTPLTFASTANAAIWQGAKIVFADIDVATGTIDLKDAAKKITKKTKAIVAVDYGGMPADLDALRAIAKKHKLVLIEDGAHSLGASYKGRPVGSVADMTMFSFHPVKPVTAGEGGIITTDSEEYYEKLKMFRNHGMTRDTKLMEKKDAPAWHYEMLYLGLNYWMTDFQAALGISQLKKLDQFRKKRAALAQGYQKMLGGNKNLILPKEPAGYVSGWHLYALRLSPALAGKRDEVFKALQKAGIGVQVHYIPVYWHPYYRTLGYKKGLCPKAEEFFKTEISIPLFPDLTKKEQAYVAKEIAKLI